MANVQWKSTNTNQWQRCRWRAPVWMENVKWREKRTHSHTNLCAGNGIPYRYTFNSPRYPPVFIRRYKLIRKVIECRNMNAGKMKNREKEREKVEKKNEEIFAGAYHRKRSMKASRLPEMLFNSVHLLQIYTLWISRLLIIIMSNGKHRRQRYICRTDDDVPSITDTIYMFV